MKRGNDKILMRSLTSENLLDFEEPVVMIGIQSCHFLGTDANIFDLWH